MTEVIKPKFDDIKVSTKTIIAFSNLEIEIENLFYKLPITSYIVIPKKRGRKRREDCPNPNEKLEPGSIITVKYQDNARGVDIKAKKNKKSKKYFRNALTIVMVIEKNKLINFKISKNGKFQITGCKNDEHAELCVKYFWNHLKDLNEIYRINGDILKVLFLTVMTNIDFNIGFYVNREALDNYINTNTSYNSLLETSFGYTGVNIKIPMKIDPNMEISSIHWIESNWENHTIRYTEYLNGLSPKDLQHAKNKKKFNTFLVFQSGNIIMSGMIKKYMEPFYDNFFEIIENCKHKIKENLTK